MKKEVFDAVAYLSLKLLACMYVISTVIIEQLFLIGFNLYFLYIGLVGQIVATLVDVHRLSSKDNFQLRVTWGKVINTISQLLIAPILAFLITSLMFKTLTPTSVITAFCIGAFWEFAWRYLKRKAEDGFKDENRKNRQ
jgi:hypothetical protein